MKKRISRNDCAWAKVDEQLLLLKQGNIKTKIKSNSKQTYRLRVVRWGNYQAVVQKRLYRFSQPLMDFMPGRLMSLNMEDMKIIFENKDKIMEIMQKVYDNIPEESIYKRQLIFHKEQEQKELKEKETKK